MAQLCYQRQRRGQLALLHSLPACCPWRASRARLRRASPDLSG